MTAYYGLHVAAQLQPGESVLIHSGAGGTGQAAIQVAQAIGAVIYNNRELRREKEITGKALRIV